MPYPIGGGSIQGIRVSSTPPDDGQALIYDGIADEYIPQDVATVGGLNIRGDWDANANSPDLTILSPPVGDYWYVKVAGTTNLGGISSWSVGDYAVSLGGGSWLKISSPGGVITVNGQAGIVVLDADDVGADPAGTASASMSAHTSAFVHSDIALNTAARHSHTNKTELDKVTDGDHDVRTDNPHATTAVQVGADPTGTAAAAVAAHNAAFVHSDIALNTAARHSHTNKAELDKVTDGDHDVRTDNPHATTAVQVGADPTGTAAAAVSAHDSAYVHTDIALNSAARHSQGTDQGLDTGGPNAVTASQAKQGYTHSGTTGNPHSTTKSDIGLGNVTDDAQLKRADGDIASFTEKMSVVGDDLFLIEDSAASNAKKKVKASTLSVDGKKRVLSFSWAGSGPYIGVTTTTYAIVSRFQFDGTDLLGTIKKITALVARSAGASMDIRIYDGTNAKVIAEYIGITSTLFIIQDLGTVGNVPTGPAIFEVHLRGTTGTAARVAGVQIDL